jgi:hypothetical protein
MEATHGAQLFHPVFQNISLFLSFALILSSNWRAFSLTIPDWFA